MSTSTNTYIKLTFAALLWGGTFIAGRWVSQDLGPYSAAFIRFFLASLILFPMVRIEESSFPIPSGRQAIAILMLGLSGVFFYNYFFFSGLKTVEAGRAAVIIAANPVFIALFSYLIYHERFSVRKLIGIALSVAGAMVVISRGDVSQVLGGGIGRGELYLIGCVISWVIYTLIGKKVMSGLTPLVAVAYSATVGALVLLPAAIREGVSGDLAAITLSNWMALIYLAFFGTVLGFVWFYHGVREIGPARAGVFINLVPVSGVFLGYLILHEQLTYSLLTGGSLVILGLFLTNRPASR